MEIEQVTDISGRTFWVPSNDIHINSWKNKKLPFCQHKCLDRFDRWLTQEAGKTYKINLALDVGAWCGTWADTMSKHCEKIICFEPDPLNFKCLQKNIKSKKIKCENIALGNYNGSASLTEDNFTQAKRIIKEEGNIKMYKIDEYLSKSKIDLIKIDAEGYELKILEGAKKKIKDVKFLMLEMNSNTSKYGSSNMQVESYVIHKLGFKMLIKLWPDVVYIRPNAN